MVQNFSPVCRTLSNSCRCFHIAVLKLEILATTNFENIDLTFFLEVIRVTARPIDELRSPPSIFSSLLTPNAKRSSQNKYSSNTKLEMVSM